MQKEVHSVQYLKDNRLVDILVPKIHIRIQNALISSVSNSDLLLDSSIKSLHLFNWKILRFEKDLLYIFSD